MGCKFATLDLSSFDTRKVTDFSNFVGSSYLTTLILGSNFKTSSATNFFYMFAGCSSLTSLDLSGFDTSNVTSTYCMFNGCSSLTRLDLSSFNTSKVTTMYHMFANCTNLKYLDISSFNMSKVTVVTNMLMFGSSNKIETLKTPYNNTAELPITTGSTLYNEAGNVVTSVPANTSSSLTYTNTLPYKTFPETWKTEIASTTYMTTTVDANNLTSIKFEFSAPSGYSQIGTLSTGIKVYKSTSSSTQIAFVNEKTIYAPENCSYMFDLMTSLKSITFNNFDTSKTTTMVNMFSNCDFTTLDLSGFDTSNVTSFNAFIQGVTYMTSLKLGTKFDTSKSTDFQYMFQGCMSLTTLDLSMFNTSKAIYMNCMFQSCSGLTSLDLSKFNMKSATYVSDMLNFGSSNKIKIIKTPYKNSISIEITTGSSLYDVSTGLSAPQLPANVTASKTYSTKVVLNFDAVGGTCSTSSITGYYGVSLYDIGKSLPTPTKIGYTFEGWSSSMGSITNATKLYLDSPAKITAKWTEGEESDLQIKETLSEVISNAFASNGIDYDDNYVNELIFYSNFNIHYEPFSAQEYSSFSSDAGWRLLGTYIGSNVYYIKHTEGVYSVAFVCDIDEGFTIKVEDFVNAFAPFNALTSLDMSGVSVEDPTNTTVAQLPGSLQVFATPISWSNPTFSYVDMSGAFLSLESANGTQIDQVTHFQYSNVFGQGGFWFGGEPTLAYIEVSSNPITMDDEYNWSFNGSYLVGYVPYNRTLMKYIPIELNVWPSDYSEQGYWEIVGGDVCYIVVDDISTFIDSDGYVHFIQAYQVSSFLEQDNKNQFEIEMDGEISISYSETCILPEKKGFVVEIEKDKKVG